MKNIFKTLSIVKFDSERRSHEVILAARRAARDAVINPQATKWSIPSDATVWPPLR